MGDLEPWPSTAWTVLSIQVCQTLFSRVWDNPEPRPGELY